MAVLTIGNTFANGDQVTASSLNNAVNDAVFASGAVDSISTQLAGSGAIIVKDLGIDTGKIATGAVTTAKLASNSVSTAKIIDSNVTKAKIENFTNLTVLGNVSGSSAAPAEVTILDEDNMVSDSATSLATQQSIKAYADSKVDGTGAGAFTTLTASGDANFDSGTLFVDASANSVGIGTSSPSYLLDVSPTSNGGEIARFKSDTTNAAADVLIVDQDNSSTRAALQVQGNAGSTECLFVGSNGDVGIGTTTPSYKLDVSGDFRAFGAFRDSSGNAGTSGQILSSTGTETNWISSIWTTSGSDIYYNTGNVGIGTPVPNSALEVSGNGAEIIINDTTTSRPQLSFYDSGSSLGRIYADSSELRFETSGNGMRLDALGNVGIGTTGSPNSILEISSTTSGVIMPRMNTTEMNAISSPTNGEMIYNTSANKFYGYANGSWVALH